MNHRTAAPEFQVSAYDYDLPEALIAQFPAENRGDSRLLVLKRKTGEILHKAFSDLPEFLSPSDLLVLNDTKVRPARLEGRKHPTGGKVSVLLLKNRDGRNTWEALVRGKTRPGMRLRFNENLNATVVEKLPEGKYLLSFQSDQNPQALVDRIGLPPLPPYIRRSPRPEDRHQYQTVFAKNPGSLAAPTAGLHFTPELLEAVHRKGVMTPSLTLHVGTGTFLPVRTEDIRDHQMEAEFFEIPPETLKDIQAAKKRKGRVIAVGTTSTRVLESLPPDISMDPKISGSTRLFIYPGFEFKHVNGLLTNFHIPKSTLLMLVSAFAGGDNIKRAYREAVEKKYRFLSFGDAMLIL